MADRSRDGWRRKGNDMNKAQKIAWFNIIVLGTTASLTGVSILVVWLIAGMPRALGGLGFLGLCGVMGLSPLIFRRKEGEVSFDERDQLINYRAVLFAYSIFWPAFTAVLDSFICCR